MSVSAAGLTGQDEHGSAMPDRIKEIQSVAQRVPPKIALSVTFTSSIVSAATATVCAERGEVQSQVYAQVHPLPTKNVSYQYAFEFCPLETASDAIQMLICG